MAVIITVNGTSLPSSITGLKQSNELLWSEGTGRGATSGYLVGSVIAPKKTFAVQWDILTSSEYTALLAAIPNGFFSLVIQIDGETIASNNCYRGALAAEFVGSFGNNYWRNVSVDFIER